MSRIGHTTASLVLISALFLAAIPTVALLGYQTPEAKAEVQSKLHEQPNIVTYDTSKLKPWQAMTPFGPWNATDVHEYNGTVIDGNAKIAEAKARNYNPPDQYDTHWNEYAYSQQFGSLTSFEGNWRVPSAPSYGSSYTGNQVTYVFIGLRDAAHTGIAQPVLQWGCSVAYCGNSWQLASWFLVGASVYHSHAIPASTGDMIKGSIVWNFGRIWTVTTYDVTKGTNTGLQVEVDIALSEADVTLETYYLPAQCGYLPGNISFTNLYVNGGTAYPIWTGRLNGAWCNPRVEIINSSTITLHTQS